MTAFVIKVWHVEQTCLFELMWGHSHTISAKLLYPATLTKLYEQWRADYLAFYRSNFLARPGISFSLPESEIDWRAKLVESEAAFLAEFQHWLNSAELAEIQRTIRQAANEQERVDLFVRCDTLEMVKLPWESWQVDTSKPIRITRTANRLPADSTKPERRRKARILAILGDDTGLQSEDEQEDTKLQLDERKTTFTTEQSALKKLSTLVDITFVEWQKGKNIIALKDEICLALTDEQGWDILFFTGHSNETAITGGQIAIAPNSSIMVKEIAQELQVAQAKGLQFAIFNSCSGVSIAESLINLGLNQVAVMREPIHHKVAKEFLLQFVQQIAQFKDAHEAMLAACQVLKQDKNWIYPSAYLIPSLFTHPQALPFCLKPTGWKPWQPTRREAIVLGITALLSSLLPIQSFLIDQRQSIQANYQTITAQTIQTIPRKTPPILLVQVDEPTLRNVEVINQNLDRKYLAKLVNRATELNLSTIGLDYLLFRPQPNGDPVLAQALSKAGQKGTKIILAASPEQYGPPKWSLVLPEIAHPQQLWRIDGDIDLLGDPPFYARVIGDTNAQTKILPMAYALVQQTLGLRKDARFLIHPVSKFAEKIGQMWLRPLIDFSVPPDQVYQAISAQDEFMNKNRQQDLQKAIANQPIVLIAPGGHIDAGVTPGEDNFNSPVAFQHFSSRLKITGGEVHAYLVHNLIHHRLIIPIPDLWMLGLAGLLGKGSSLWLARQNQKSRRAIWLLSIPILYTAVSLQTYVWCAVLLPVLFPTVTYLAYLVPFIWKRDHHA